MSVEHDALLRKIEAATSSLNRIDSGVADPALSAFMHRRGAKELITQLRAIRDTLEGGPLIRTEGRSGGIGRAVVENVNDIAHPLASLCLEVEADYNKLVQETGVTCSESMIFTPRSTASRS